MTQCKSKEQAWQLAIIAGVFRVSATKTSHFRNSLNYNIEHCGSHDVSEISKGFMDFFQEIAFFLDEYADEVIELC